MGLRFRKSINVGWGFRINISKSGIGYSWGVPGYRKTWKANGGERTTYSIPGTGISYVEETTRSKYLANNAQADGSPRSDDGSVVVDGGFAREDSIFTNHAVIRRNFFIWLACAAVMLVWLFLIEVVPTNIWMPICISLCALFVPLCLLVTLCSTRWRNKRKEVSTNCCVAKNEQTTQKEKTMKKIFGN